MRKKDWQTALNRFGATVIAAGLPFTHLLGYAGCGIALISGRWVGLFRNKRFINAGLPLCIFLTYVAIRGIFVSDHKLSFMVLLNLLSHWAVPFVVGYSVGAFSDKILRIYVYSFVTLTVIGILSIFNILPKTILGDNLWSNKGLSCFHHHNTLASMLIIAINVAFFKSIYWGIWLLTMAFFLTGSRGYLLVSPVSFLGLVYIGVKRKLFKHIVFLVVGIIIGIGGMIKIPLLHNRAQTIVTETWRSDKSVQARFGFWDAGFMAIRQNLIFGIGPGQLQTRKDILEKVRKDGLLITKKNKVKHLHNFYVTVAAEEGILGIVILLWMFYKLGSLLWKDSSKNGKAFLGAYWAFLLGNMFDSQLRGPSGAMDLFFIMGLLISNSESNKPQ